MFNELSDVDDSATVCSATTSSLSFETASSSVSMTLSEIKKSGTAKMQLIENYGFS
jgi:hypothetical protein